MHACEAGELAGTKDLCAAAGDSIAACEIGSALCLAVAGFPDVVLWNRVVGLGLEDPVGDGELDGIDAFFATAGTRYGVALAPGADPGLAGRLAERGFEPGYAWMKFEREANAPPGVTSDLRIEEIDAGEGDAFAAVFASGWGVPEQATAWCAALPGRPGWHCFLAFDGHAAVACGALYVAGEIGWLGLGGTLPEHRGRGAQSALLAARIGAASSLGCDRVVTETGERVADRPSGSYRNILRAGFAEAYLRPNYVSPSAGTTADD